MYFWCYSVGCVFVNVLEYGYRNLLASVGVLFLYDDSVFVQSENRAHDQIQLHSI